MVKLFMRKLTKLIFFLILLILFPYKSVQSSTIDNLKKLSKFTEKNLTIIRPYHGLHPKFYDFVLNKKSKTNLFSGDPLKLKHVQK